MATLTLKKSPEYIGDRPLDLFMGRFAVMRQARKTSTCKISAIHDTFKLAQKEAERLQKINPTERFLIVFVAGFVDWTA
jgi:hypothetical protein